MSVNLNKVATLVRGVDALLALCGKDSIDEEQLVDQMIQRAIDIAIYQFTAEEIDAAKRDITYKYKVYTKPGESILSDYDQEEWYSDLKSKIEQRFWTRYKSYLIDNKDFSPNVVSTLGDDTLDIMLMNCIGNPNSANGFLRRGLIIGDVQSGKTSTYIGLMCKAADAGYRVFILLTGTIESLRKQTQERVEEGFIGIDMTAENLGGRRVGVGLDNKDIYAMAMTSRYSDFVGNLDRIAISLRNHDAIVFVVKKNTTVLNKIKKWLISLNADPQSGKIDVPMLLIDDEADNASINTNIDRDDPTKINRLIRELIDLFTKSNYIGFTATPFANVFIDPRTTNEMENHDLFPEDFIVALPTPSNYIGPSDIFSNSGRYHRQLIYVNDAGRERGDGYPFYFKHSKEWDDDLPESLTDAIYTFYLANAIRDLRGDHKEHRSMLINMSRFVAVQKNIKQKVEEIHNHAYRALKFNLSIKSEKGLRDPVIIKLKTIWEVNYSSTEFSWDKIAESLFASIESIQIKVVNSTRQSERLTYPTNESLRVIAIGGLALSRGLTLEGLVTSYFYRNTSTYDVLMQMGRWFGYRYGYDDLFRIWTHPDSAKWYAEIAEATNSLKDDMSLMRELKMKPKDFGIRVRNDSDELNITASNKMRNAVDEYEFTSYFGGYIETPYLHADTTIQKSNFQAVVSLIEYCIESGIAFERRKFKDAGEHFILRQVPKDSIIELLKHIQISRFSSNFDTIQIVDFLLDCTEHQLDKWDIAFMDGVRNEDKVVNISECKIYKVIRDNCLIDSESGRLSIGRRGKVGGPNDGLMGITEEHDYTEAKNNFIEEYLNAHPGLKLAKDPTFPSDTWFKYISNRAPLLLVYFIDVLNTEEHSTQMEKFKNEMGDIPVTAFAIGMPRNEAAAAINRNKYRVNKIYNWFDQDSILAENEEE